MPFLWQIWILEWWFWGFNFYTQCLENRFPLNIVWNWNSVFVGKSVKFSDVWQSETWVEHGFKVQYVSVKNKFKRQRWCNQKMNMNCSYLQSQLLYLIKLSCQCGRCREFMVILLQLWIPLRSRIKIFSFIKYVNLCGPYIFGMYF